MLKAAPSFFMIYAVYYSQNKNYFCFGRKNGRKNHYITKTAALRITQKPLVSYTFLELIGRFELPTSSLPIKGRTYL